MNQHDDTKKHDGDDFHLFEKQSSKWLRVVFIGFVCIVAVLVIAYSTFEIGSFVIAVIGRWAPSPDIIILLFLIPIAVLVQLS
jgi:hypothetical protein